MDYVIHRAVADTQCSLHLQHSLLFSGASKIWHLMTADTFFFFFFIDIICGLSETYSGSFDSFGVIPVHSRPDPTVETKQMSTAAETVEAITVGCWKLITYKVCFGLMHSLLNSMIY